MQKIAVEGDFEIESRSYLFQLIKMPMCTKFHVAIPKCTIRANFSIKSPDQQGEILKQADFYKYFKSVGNNGFMEGFQAQIDSCLG